MGNTIACPSIGSARFYPHYPYGPTQNEINNPCRTPTPSLHKGIIRERRNQNPFLYYEVVETLGSGALGTVSKVRKRKLQPQGHAKNKLVTCVPRSCSFLETTSRIKPRFSKNGDENKPYSTYCFGSRYLPIFFKKRNLVEDDPTTCSSKSSSDHSLSDQSLSRSVRGIQSIYNSSFGSHVKFYAIKSLNLNHIWNRAHIRDIHNEIDILRTMDHPNIVRPIETFEFRRQIHIIMECCSGGDLYTRDPYRPKDAVRIIKKVLLALSYMHRFNVMHRDIKFENIMFENCQPKAEVKVIDFGLSKKHAPENPFSSEPVGTFYTMAPEVFEGEYDSKADLWSLGVVSFMLLSSQFPFHGKNRRCVINNIKLCNYKFRGRRWKSVSDDGLRFVHSLLQYDPEERPTALEAMDHPFLYEHFEDSTSNSWSVRRREKSTSIDSFITYRSPSSPTMKHIDITSSIENFTNYCDLKKLSLMIIAYKSTSKELGGLRKAFAKFDIERNGTISFKEFQAALSSFGYSDEKIENMFHGVNIDATGLINYTEFLAATIETLGVIEEERLAEAFDRLDTDNSGYISLEDLRELFGGEKSDEKIMQIIAEVDVTNSNKISYGQFLLLWEQVNDRHPSVDGMRKKLARPDHSHLNGRGNHRYTLSY